jgi:hypothetical protein
MQDKCSIRIEGKSYLAKTVASQNKWSWEECIIVNEHGFMVNGINGRIQ